MSKKTTWVEKRDFPNGELNKVVKMEGKSVGRWGTKAGDTCAISSPKEIDSIIKKIPFGKTVTINDLRSKLAKKYNTDIACPITTGIFAWICANAAEEENASGKKNITPWWRVLKLGNELNPKYPNYPEQQKSLLISEGHNLIQKGKKWIVAN